MSNITKDAPRPTLLIISLETFQTGIIIFQTHRLFQLCKVSLVSKELRLGEIWTDKKDGHGDTYTNQYFVFRGISQSKYTKLYKFNLPARFVYKSTSWILTTYQQILLQSLLMKQPILSTKDFIIWKARHRKYISFFFSVPLLSVLRALSFFFIPPTTANDLRLRRIFYPRFYPLHFIFFLS